MEKVPFFDILTRQVIEIPESELAPGCELISREGSGTAVYVDRSALKERQPKHSREDLEQYRVLIEKICSTFAEARQMTIDDWFKEFSLWDDPQPHIYCWKLMSEFYEEAIAEKEYDLAQRIEMVGLLVTASGGRSHDETLAIAKPSSLTREESLELLESWVLPGDED